MRGISLSQFLIWSGSISLSLVVTDMRPSQKTKKKRTVNAVPEMGFLTSGNGTSTGNGRPISSNGKLRIWVLTHTRNDSRKNQVSWETTVISP